MGVAMGVVGAASGAGHAGRVVDRVRRRCGVDLRHRHASGQGSRQVRGRGGGGHALGRPALPATAPSGKRQQRRPGQEAAAQRHRAARRRPRDPGPCRLCLQRPGVEPPGRGDLTLMYAAAPTGPWQVWDAPEYGQVNPLTTDAEGRYAWFVPEGFYQVLYPPTAMHRGRARCWRSRRTSTSTSGWSCWRRRPHQRDGTGVRRHQADLQPAHRCRMAQRRHGDLHRRRDRSADSRRRRPGRGHLEPGAGGAQLATVFRFTPAAESGEDRSVTITVNPAVPNFAGTPLGQAAVQSVILPAGDVDPGPGPDPDPDPEPQDPAIVSAAKPVIAGAAKVGVASSASTGSTVDGAPATGSPSRLPVEGRWCRRRDRCEHVHAGGR